MLSFFLSLDFGLVHFVPIDNNQKESPLKLLVEVLIPVLLPMISANLSYFPPTKQRVLKSSEHVCVRHWAQGFTFVISCEFSQLSKVSYYCPLSSKQRNGYGDEVVIIFPD